MKLPLEAPFTAIASPCTAFGFIWTTYRTTAPFWKLTTIPILWVLATVLTSSTAVSPPGGGASAIHNVYSAVARYRVLPNHSSATLNCSVKLHGNRVGLVLGTGSIGGLRPDLCGMGCCLRKHGAVTPAEDGYPRAGGTQGDQHKQGCGL